LHAFSSIFFSSLKLSILSFDLKTRHFLEKPVKKRKSDDGKGQTIEQLLWKKPKICKKKVPVDDGFKGPGELIKPAC